MPKAIEAEIGFPKEYAEFIKSSPTINESLLIYPEIRALRNDNFIKEKKKRKI